MTSTATLLAIHPGDFLWEPYISFVGLPLFIQIAVVLTVVAVLFTLISYGMILSRRWVGAKDERREAKLLPVVDDLIVNQVILNEDLGNGMPVEHIEFDLDALSNPKFRPRWAQEFMVKHIIHYRRNLAGDMGLLLCKLFRDIGLEKISVSRLNSTSWSRKVQGLYEHMTMGVPIADVTMLPLTNSKQPELRAAARNAYIQLSKNDPFKFFDVATEPLLPWDSLELFKTITTNKHISIPSFSRWISYSANPSIISFCLKLIVHYNQQSAVPSIIKLLDTTDHVLRAQAINTLGKLTAEDAEDRLVDIYSSQPIDCQMEILKAVGRIGSGRHLDFLTQEFRDSMDYDIRKHAAKSMLRQRGRSETFLADLEAVISQDHKLILKHVSHPLIKN